MYDREAEYNYDCKCIPPANLEEEMRYHEHDGLLEAEEPERRDLSLGELLVRLWSLWFNPWWQPPR